MLSQDAKRMLVTTIVGTTIYTWFMVKAGILDGMQVISTPDEPVTNLKCTENPLCISWDFGTLGTIVLEPPEVVQLGAQYVGWLVNVPFNFIGVWIELGQTVNLFGFEWILILPAFLIIMVLIGIVIRLVEVVWIG